MNCPECGRVLICAACGHAVETASREPGADVERLVRAAGTVPGAEAPAGDKTFLIVARGHADLLDQLQEVVGDLGWVRLVEDRRHDETLLPREGRQGTARVDREIEP